MTSATAAYAYGEDDDAAPASLRRAPLGRGIRQGMLTARKLAPRIKVTQVSGGTPGGSPEALAPVDPNWEPPPCWYEPVATPQQLKAACGRAQEEAQGDLVRVTPSLSWGEELMVSHYEKGEDETDGEGYKNYNLGKDGMFWRGDDQQEQGRTTPRRRTASRNLFWQNATRSPTTSTRPHPRSSPGTPTTRSRSRKPRSS